MDFDYTSETITPDITGYLTFGGTQCVELPSSTTANRPATAEAGMLRFNTSLVALEYYNGTVWVQPTGTVTSVALTVPSFLSVSGSPITTAGTLAVSYSGTALPVANGGTGLTTTPGSGTLLIGNGSGYTLTTLTQGTGITITDGAGSITLANAGVTSIAGTTNQVTASASTGAVTLSTPSTFIAPGSIAYTTYFVNGVTTISAAGATQSTATAITSSEVNVTTVASGTGVRLPTNSVGLQVAITNNGANTLNVYPDTGSTIDTAAANVAVTIPVSQTAEYTVLASGAWYSTEDSEYAGTGISVTRTAGGLTFANTGVTSFQTSLSGLTPNTATTGAITLAGTLNAANGGTGTGTAPTSGQILVGTSGGQYVPYTLASGTGISTTTGSGTLQINNTGVTSIAGTANQIAASAATGAVTLSITNPFIAPGVVEFTNGLMYNSVSAAVSAAGTTQGTATALIAQYNVVTTAAAGTGVALPTPTIASTSITITNEGANPILVYPASGGTIDGLSANVAVTLPVGTSATYSASSTTQWYVTAPAIVAGTNITVSYGAGQTTIGTIAYMSSSVVVPGTLVSGTTYSSTVTTNLGTENIVASIYNNSTLQLVTPQAVLNTSPNGFTLEVTGNSNAYLVAVATGTAEFTVTPSTLVSGNTYSSTIQHNLGTNNFVVCVYNNSTGALVIGASVQQTNTNTIVLSVTGNTTTYRVVLALGTQYQVTPATLVSGTTYSSTITHNLNTNNIVVCVYNNSTGQLVTPLSIQQTSVNALVLEVTGNTNTYNVIIVNGTVVSTSNSTTGSVIRAFTFYATSLSNPNSSDWAVNSLAPSISDPTYPSMTVRQFSTSAEGGVGTFITVPSNAANITISFKGRAQTAPASSSTIIPYFYTRSVPNNAAVGAWSAHYALTAQTVPTNALFQYYTQTTTALATYGMTAGGLYLVQFDISTTGTYTTSNWLMAELTFTFT